MGVIVSFKQRAAHFGHFLNRKPMSRSRQDLRWAVAFPVFASEVGTTAVTSKDWEYLYFCYDWSD